MKKIFFHSIILSSTLFITQNIYADETFVYCANENREWKWLPTGRVIDNGEIVKVQGEWGIKKTNNNYEFRYFKLAGGKNKFLELQSNCITKFGEDFHYSHPADDVFSIWKLFAISDNHTMPGTVTFSSQDLPLALHTSSIPHIKLMNEKIWISQN